MTTNRTVVLALLLPILAGCAGSAKSRIREEQKASADINMQVAASDIEAAKAAGAATLAPNELSQARASLKAAGEQFRNKSYAESRRLALQATEEAKAAKARAQEAKEKEREARERAASAPKPAKKKPGTK